MALTPKISSSEDTAYPNKLKAEECTQITARRAVATPNQDDGTGPGKDRHVGIGLSGGGIRSATFCLGIFQSLAKNDCLKYFDFMSTVSGGGYFGGFLGRLFTRKENTPDSIKAKLANSQSPEIKWLRENGRYLAPNGSGDVLTGTAVLLRGWAAVIVVLGVFFLTLFIGADLLKYLVGWTWQQWHSRLPAGVVSTVEAAFGWTTSVSPYVWLPIIVFLMAVVPLGWAFWLRSGKATDEQPHFRLLPTVVAIGTVAASLFLWWWLPRESSSWAKNWRDNIWLLVAAEATLALIWYWLACLRAWLIARNKSVDLIDRNELLENRLADWMGWMIALAVGLLVFAGVDTLGNLLHQRGATGLYAGISAIVATLGNVVVPLAQKIVAAFGAKPGKVVRLGWGSTIVLNVVGLGIAFFLLTLLNSAAHAIVEPVVVSESSSTAFLPGLACAAAVGLLLLVLSFISGQTMNFLNRSTPSGIYQARLTRAYLGASNPRRHDNSANADVTDVVPGDGITLGEYSPHLNGGPLHIINSTINETVDGRSQIEQQDRKGLGLAVGPCGVSVGVRHHAVWSSEERRELQPVIPKAKNQEFWVFDRGRGLSIEPEELDVGRWLAISGAAFSTGIGYRTCLGLSILCGLFNVRLGYYWDSGIDPLRRQVRGSTGPVRRIGQFLAWVFPAQMGLIDEFTARFHGTAQRLWNLSDGGVFENLGTYELIRRRVPFIFVVDAGEDHNYEFEDLGNLVRKARTDFGAEITFLTPEQISSEIKGGRLPEVARNIFGAKADLRRVRQSPGTGPNAGGRPLGRLSLHHAAIATVKYADSETAEPDAVLFYIKPTLTGDEPADVIQYAKSHPTFPHESTADQFFDEAQWESYRELGEHIGNQIFPIFADRKWNLPQSPV